MYILSFVMRFPVVLPMDLFHQSIYVVRLIGYMGRIVLCIVRDLLAFGVPNVGSLFYLTIIRCHLEPLLHRACGLR